LAPPGGDAIDIYDPRPRPAQRNPPRAAPDWDIFTGH
jgi:hypothetical protein